MNIRKIVFILMFIGLLFMAMQLYQQSRNCNILPQLSTIELYAHARLPLVHNTTDPPCSNSRNIYVCAGYCPWPNTDNNQLVSCSFLPRIPHPDFVQYNIYCIPDPDQCPTYNAWLKDNLPLTQQAIKQIPAHLLSNFTLNYSIPVGNTRHEFPTEDSLPANWTIDFIETYRRQVRAREAFGSYGNKDIYPALDKYGSIAIKDKKCAVIGTQFPWIEAALLEYNASSVTTIEYTAIYSSVPRLFTITVTDFAKKQQNESNERQLFDSIWSYSSIEHDGLSRYRDPLNPYGDFQTMIKISCIIKPGGFLFLGVPLNTVDFLEYNLHRIYGPIRLPLLYRNYHIVEVLGPGMSKTAGDDTIQSFVVLQNKVGCKTA